MTQACRASGRSSEISNPTSQPAAGSLLASQTGEFHIPWAEGTAHPFEAVTFDFTGLNIVLPDEVIFGVAFNTTNYGANPTGYVGPYDSLNLGAFSSSPLAGTDVDPGMGFVNSSWVGGMYGPTTSSGSGFRISDGEDFAAGYRPSVEFNAVPEPVSMSLLALGGLAALIRRRRSSN